MMRYILLLVSLFFSFKSFSQQIRPSTSAEIYKEIKALKNLPKVLYIAAHPDDENTGLLSWLVNDQSINTAYLSLTRGDGGQNLIGSEQGAALGLIRTHELLAARKVDGAKQFFSTAIDFGFSKNPEDTFTQWDLDSITSDVVWIIRNFRPDIIITRFPPTAAAGHGQHSASAIIAEAAFKAAGDQNRYPEQLKEVSPWQATRLLWNTFRFGNTNTTNENQFKVTVGQYDPLLGMSYGELAGVSRSLHQSQGAGTPSVAGVRTEYFTLVSGEPLKNSLFDGVKSNWADLKRTDIDQAIDKVLKQYNFTQPDLSIPELLKIRKLINSINDLPLKREKLSAIDQIILSSTGFMAEMINNQAEALAGEVLGFQLNVVARSKTPVSILHVRLPSDQSNIKEINKIISNDSLINFSYQVKIPENTEPSEPYWLKYPTKTATQYDVRVDSLIGLPVAPSPLNVKLSLLIGGEPFEVSVPLSYKKLDPIKGDVVESLRIVPEVNIKFTQSLFFQKGQNELDLAVKISPLKDLSNATLKIKNGDHTVSTISNIKLQAGKDTTIRLSVNSKQLAELAKSSLSSSKDNQNSIKAVLEAGNKSYDKDQKLIQYQHIPTLQYFTPADAKIINDNLKVTAKRIGYIQGAGDFIPDVLRMAGIEVTVLEESDFSNANKLSGFDAIVLGIRAFNVEKRLVQWMPVLNQYVNNGGTMIVQFNTSHHLVTTNIGPYPLTISNQRVTEEHAKVRILAPNQPILNYPNKINDSDFQGWIQERGLYFASSWNKNYTPLFEMHDTGEQNLEGSTLYASYGKGNYIYTSLAFFRQIPNGNEGAIKLFFNFLSIGKNEKK